MRASIDPARPFRTAKIIYRTGIVGYLGVMISLRTDPNVLQTYFLPSFAANVAFMLISVAQIKRVAKKCGFDYSKILKNFKHGFMIYSCVVFALVFVVSSIAKAIWVK